MIQVLSRKEKRLQKRRGSASVASDAPDQCKVYDTKTMRDFLSRDSHFLFNWGLPSFLLLLLVGRDAELFNFDTGPDRAGIRRR